MQKFRGHYAIDMAVIAGQADAQHLPDLDPPFVCDGFFRDHSHAENRALRLIDDRRTELHRKLAQIRDRKRPAGIVVRRQPSLASSSAFCAATTLRSEPDFPPETVETSYANSGWPSSTRWPG